MTSRLTHTLLTVLSMVYGAVLAVLGATGSSATGIVALVGALVLGIAWAVRSMLLRSSVR